MAPSWLIGMLFGGVVAGLASLVVAALARFGFSSKNFALILPMIIGITGVGSRHIGEFLQMQLLTPEITSGIMKAQSPAIYGLLETSFPEDYASMTAQLTELLKSGATIDEVTLRAQSLMAAIRRRYAPMVALANDADQAALLDTQIRIYQTMLEVEPQLCPAFAVEGPQALSEGLEKGPILEVFDDQAISLFRAAAGAIRAPTKRRAATADDWAQLTSLMLARGATPSQIEAIVSLQPDSPDLCASLIMLMKIMNETDSEGGRAARSQFLTNLVSG